MTRAELDRILLVRTWRPVGTGGPVPPLGLLYLASALRAARPGAAIRLVDMGHAGIGASELERICAEFRPGFVGLSAMTCEAEALAEAARAAKRACPEAAVVAGGPHATAAPAAALSEPAIDFAVVGEGERTAPELIAALAGGGEPARVPGVAARGPGGARLATPREPVPELDALPPPAWDLVDLRAYAKHATWNGPLAREFYAPVLTSRGCPYACVFCHNIFGKRVRARSPESVLAELRALHAAGCREFHVVDDIFNYDRARAERICRLIADSGLDLALSFPNGLRADRVDDALVGLLRRAGTYRVQYGFETASPRLQALLRKELDPARAAAVFAATARAGIVTGAYFMLGIPTETRAEMEATIAFAERSELDLASFFKATAYPGTPLYESLRAREKDLSALHFFSAERSNEEVGPEELNALLLEAQRRFYFKPRRVLRGLRKAPRKGAYLGALAAAYARLLQARLASELAGGRAR